MEWGIGSWKRWAASVQKEVASNAGCAYASANGEGRCHSLSDAGLGDKERIDAYGMYREVGTYAKALGST